MKLLCKGWFFLVLIAAVWMNPPVWAALQDEAQDEPQSEEEAPPDAEAICKELDKLLKEKRDLDVEAVLAHIQLADETYESAPPAGQAQIVKTLKKVFDIQPLPDDAVLKAAIGALSGMEKKGNEALFYALKHKNLKPKSKTDEEDWQRKTGLQAFIIEAIGFNKEKSSIKDLTKLLWDDETAIVIAAGKALSNFADLPLKERKSIVQELVKIYATISSLSAANPKRDDYRQRLLQVEVPFNEALRALTLQSFENSVDWEKWYNDNKNEPKW